MNVGRELKECRTKQTEKGDGIITMRKMRNEVKKRDEGKITSRNKN